MNTKHNEVKLIIENGKPYGIRDSSGYLFFFTKIQKYSGQDERYRSELVEQFELADYLVEILKKREIT